MAEIFMNNNAYRLDDERASFLACFLEKNAEKAGTCSVHEIDEDRQEIFDMIVEEREYQDEKWVSDDSRWAINDWLEFIRRQIKIAHANTGDEPAAMCCVRKIAALAVAAMEYYDTPSRQEEDIFLELKGE
jgi:hypothetical protein